MEFVPEIERTIGCLIHQSPNLIKNFLVLCLNNYVYFCLVLFLFVFRGNLICIAAIQDRRLYFLLRFPIQFTLSVFVLRDKTKDNKVIYVHFHNLLKEPNHFLCKIKLSVDCMFVEYQFETIPTILVKVYKFFELTWVLV